VNLRLIGQAIRFIWQKMVKNLVSITVIHIIYTAPSHKIYNNNNTILIINNDLQISIIANFKKAWHHKLVLSSDSSANEVDELKNKKPCSQAQKSNFIKDSDSSESEEEG